MPTYEYACRACGEHLEVVQSFRDEPLRHCPACGGDLRKVFAAAGVIFKGSGWHIKDYAAARNGDERAATSDKDKSAGAADGASATDSGKDTADERTGAATGDAAKGSKQRAGDGSGGADQRASSGSGSGEDSAKKSA